MSTKKLICFCTFITDTHYHSLGADKLVKSAKYFHPDIPFHVLGSDWINKQGGLSGHLMALCMLEFINQYEWVVRFDADSMITGELTELFDAIQGDKYSVLGVRNNNDLGKAGKDAPFAQPGRGTEHYLNAGFVATNSREFLEQWAQHNQWYSTMLPFVEQSTFNALTQRFPTKILDSPWDNVFYGVAGLYGDGTENETHWDSWKDIICANGELFLGHKKVKVIHHAGGNNDYKLGFHLFSDSARKRLIEITQ